MAEDVGCGLASRSRFSASRSLVLTCDLLGLIRTGTNSAAATSSTPDCYFYSYCCLKQQQNTSSSLFFAIILRPYV